MTVAGALSAERETVVKESIDGLVVVAFGERLTAEEVFVKRCPIYRWPGFYAASQISRVYYATISFGRLLFLGQFAKFELKMWSSWDRHRLDCTGT